MLIQVKVKDNIINVYLEQLHGNILDKIGREDVNYIKQSVTQSVTALVVKYCNMYSERKTANVVERENEGMGRG